MKKILRVMFFVILAASLLPVEPAEAAQEWLDVIKKSEPALYKRLKKAGIDDKKNKAVLDQACKGAFKKVFGEKGLTPGGAYDALKAAEYISGGEINKGIGMLGTQFIDAAFPALGKYIKFQKKVVTQVNQMKASWGNKIYQAEAYRDLDGRIQKMLYRDRDPYVPSIYLNRLQFPGKNSNRAFLALKAKMRKMESDLFSAWSTDKPEIINQLFAGGYLPSQLREKTSRGGVTPRRVFLEFLMHITKQGGVQSRAAKTYEGFYYHKVIAEEKDKVKKEAAAKRRQISAILASRLGKLKGADPAQLKYLKELAGKAAAEVAVANKFLAEMPKIISQLKRNKALEKSKWESWNQRWKKFGSATKKFGSAVNTWEADLDKLSRDIDQRKRFADPEKPGYKETVEAHKRRVSVLKQQKKTLEKERHYLRKQQAGLLTEKKTLKARQREIDAPRKARFKQIRARWSHLPSATPKDFSDAARAWDGQLRSLNEGLKKALAKEDVALGMAYAKKYKTAANWLMKR